MSVIQESADAFDAAYTRRTGKSAKSVGIDPISIITAIIAIITQMCPKPPAQLKADAESGSLEVVLAARSATRQALREQHPGVFLPYRRFNGDAIAASSLEVMVEAPVAKVEAVCACCA